MPRHTGVNTKALEILQFRKEQKELLAKKKEAEMLDKLWEDNDKLVRAKQERKAEQQRKQQEKLQKKMELRKLLEEEESKLVSNKVPKGSVPVPKITRAECLRLQLLARQDIEEEVVKNDEYLPTDNGCVRTNTNHKLMMERLELEKQNIELVDASGLDDALNALSIDKDSRFDKSTKALFMAFQERKLQELKAEYPNLKLSQYKDMINKLWKKSPENPLN